MAIVFTPIGENPITLGGVSTGTGLVGPFPRWSISREEQTVPNNNYLPSKFSINVNGTAVIKSADTQDITVAGQRQSRLQGEALNIIKLAVGTQSRGVLEISPYGGQPNTIRFEDARLISAEIPEQSEESSGVQTLDYSFSFEAYEENSQNNNSGSVPERDTLFWISSAEESWEFSVGNDAFTYENNNPLGDLNKTFTITRSLSAVGLPKKDGIEIFSPISKAKQWVQSRLLSQVPSDIKADLFDQGTELFYLKPLDDTLDISPYQHSNHTRTISSNILTGTYSTTDTWIFYKTAAATHSIEVNIEGAVDSPSNTISVSMTIQGIDTENHDSENNNAYANALTSFNVIKNYAFPLAQVVYTASGYTDIVHNIKLSESIGHNKTSGTITYSVSYNDLVKFIQNAATENITINDDNEEGLNKIIAKIGIIGKANGPIIQDMSTTPIKSRSVNIDVVMIKEFRTNKPLSEATAYAELYKPTGSDVYQQQKTDSWDPKTGTYNLQITWEYI